jgi:hypothetical protein
MPKPRKLIRTAILVILSLGLGGLLSSSNAHVPDSETTNSRLLESAGEIRISVLEEGIYQINLAKIGWENFQPDSFQLYHRDIPQPIWIEGDGAEAQLFFYGQTSDSLYTKENFYILRRIDSPGLRMSAQTFSPPDSTEAADYVTATLKLEENQLYAPLVEKGDPWLWRKMIGPQTETIEAMLPHATSNGGKLRIELWGNTKAPADPDHHVRVSVNGQLVADDVWDGQIRHKVEASIPGGILQDGSNTIEIKIPGDTGSTIEIVYLDWLEIDYARQPQAEGDRLIFSAGTKPVELTGFGGSPVLFDVTNPQKMIRTELAGGSDWFDGEPGHRYFAVGPEGYLNPNGLYSSQLEPDLRNPTAGADYLAIGPPDLLIPLDPLLDWRESQNLSTLSLPVQAVYDQFNAGMPEPEAIQQFLAYAVQNWDTPPRYILLVGDTSYDFRGYTVPAENNRLPTMMVSTLFGGLTGSDVVIAEINDDPWPDLAIGRIPAQTAGQVVVFVEKTLGYEKQPFEADWQKKILAIADGQEAQFRVEAQEFLDNFSGKYITELIAPPAGSEASREVIQAIEDGSLITAYFGHGSLNMLGKDRLFSSDDVPDLSNAGRLPIMLHITCLTGLFIHPTQPSLAEDLLWQTNGGAVAILAPTSLTLPSAQGVLTTGFAEALLDSSHQRLGDIALFAWRQVPIEDQNAEDVMKTFLLLGDPALKIPSP